MAIIISRTFKGRPVQEDELHRIHLNQNTEIDYLLNRVLMRMNQPDMDDNREEGRRRLAGKTTFHGRTDDFL